MRRRNFWNLLTVAIAILGALLLCNYPVCEGDASLCAIKSEAS